MDRRTKTALTPLSPWIQLVAMFMTSQGLTIFAISHALQKKPNNLFGLIEPRVPSVHLHHKPTLLVMACIIVHRPTHTNLADHGVSFSGTYFVAAGSIHPCRSDAIMTIH